MPENDNLISSNLGMKLIKDEDNNPIFPVTLTDCIGHKETRLSVSELVNSYNINLIRWKWKDEEEDEEITNPDQYSFTLSEAVSTIDRKLSDNQKIIGTTINFIDKNEKEYQSWEYVGKGFYNTSNWRRKDSNYIRKLESIEDSVRRIELSVSPSVVEAGVRTPITLHFSFYYFDSLVPNKTFIIDDSQHNYYPDGGNGFITTTVNLIDNSLTFYVSCEDGGELIRNEITVDVVRPSYFILEDAEDPEIQSSQVKILQISKETVFENTALSNKYLIYKYPKSFGKLSSIKDQNGIEYINFFELYENDSTYYIYKSEDPMTVSSDYKQIFS